MGTISVTLPADGTTADVADYNTPVTTIVDAINGNLDNANIKTAAGIAGSKLADASLDLGLKSSVFDGWVAVSDSWTYASATTITVPSDATTKYSVGDKIKLVQTTTKYFYVVAVSATTLTVTGGTDYTVANAAISSIYYSKAATPLSFPHIFSWTPTWTNFTVSGSTVTAKFLMIGRKQYFRATVVLGGGNAPTGAVTMTFPVTSASYAGTATTLKIGDVSILDSGTDVFYGPLLWTSTTTGTVRVHGVAGTYLNSANLSGSVPMTYANGDEVTIIGETEV